MPERKKVAAKTYLCKYQDWSCAFMVDSPDGRVSDTIRFVKGAFTTVFEDEQQHLEALPQFKSQIITAKPSARVALEAAAVSLRKAAVEANADAKEAEDALAAFDKPAPAAAETAPAI